VPRTGRVLANAVTLDDFSHTAIVGSHNQKLHIVRLEGDGPNRQLETHLGEGPVNCVRVARHPRYQGDVFAACYSGAIARVDRAGSIQGFIRVHDGAVKSLRMHPTEPLGVSCSADGGLLSWELSGNLINRFPGHMAIVDDVDIDPSGTWISSVSRDFTLKIYELHSGKLIDSLPLGRQSPKAVKFLDSQTVVVTNYWGSLIRFDLVTGRVLTRQIAKNGISAVAQSREGLVAVSYDGGAYLVRSDDLTVINSLRCMSQRLQPSPLFD
jgi:WD40 repeat protein